MVFATRVAFKNGTAHSVFVACGTEKEGLRREELLGRPHVGVENRFLLQKVSNVLNTAFEFESVGVNPTGSEDDVGVE